LASGSGERTDSRRWERLDLRGGTTTQPLGQYRTSLRDFAMGPRPGQILISPRVLLAVDKTVNVEPVGEFALQGVSRPMMAYNAHSGHQRVCFAAMQVDAHHKSMTVFAGIDSGGLGAFPKVIRR
jgi:hypothetical protein